MRLYHLPKRVKHPGGFWVKVTRLPHAAFEKRCGRTKALYDMNEMVIYIDTSRSSAQQLADFGHEYVHSALDWQAEVLNLPHVNPKD